MKKNILGIVGGGQLGRMLAEAARTLAIETIVLDPTPNSPAGQVADRQILGNFDKAEDVIELASESDIITFEIESANAEALDEIERGRPDSVHPTPYTLEIIRDKYAQKEFFSSRGIAVGPFKNIETVADIESFAKEFGYPLVLKSRFGAYDGRGNATISTREDIDDAMQKLGGKKLYVEAFVPFTKELAVVAARTRSSDIKTYPVVETIQENHICTLVLAPAQISPDAAENAKKLAREVLALLPGAGVFGIEMFLTASDEVLLNEIAPRVHNSGHFTIEGSETSQFEQHVRAVMNMDLGSTKLKAPAVVMINILGARQGPANPQGIAEAEALGDVYVHIYGKADTKPERKMGHITVLAATMDEAIQLAKEARARVTI